MAYPDKLPAKFPHQPLSTIPASNGSLITRGITAIKGMQPNSMDVNGKFEAACLMLMDDYVRAQLKDAAVEDFSQAVTMLGKELLFTIVTDDSTQQAIYWLSLGADLGCSWACGVLGNLYLLGYAVHESGYESSRRLTPDRKLAIVWLERQISLLGGNYRSCASCAYRLGKLYLSGQYLDQNLRLAEKWLLVAAQNGNWEAQTLLGSEYASGTKFKQDATGALYWLNLGAVNYGEASLLLGGIYLEGLIVPKNLDMALELFPVNGHFVVRSMKLVSDKCFDGRFSELEELTAKAWLQKCLLAVTKLAEEGRDEWPCRSNAYALAELYDKGLVVEPDLDKAIYWYKVVSDKLEQDPYGQLARNRLGDLGVYVD